MKLDFLEQSMEQKSEKRNYSDGALLLPLLLFLLAAPASAPAGAGTGHLKMETVLVLLLGAGSEGRGGAVTAGEAALVSGVEMAAVAVGGRATKAVRGQKSLQKPKHLHGGYRTLYEQSRQYFQS